MALTTRSSAGSVSPTCATAITSTPRRRAVSANSTGKRPLPATRPMRSAPSGSETRCRSMLAAHSALRRLDELEQPRHLRHVPERFPRPRHRVAPRARRLEEHPVRALEGGERRRGEAPAPKTDRKSTRLNSSHVAISYAVFWLKL